MTDNSLTPAKDGVGAHLSVRLDSRTAKQLNALVRHFNPPNGHTAHPGIPAGAMLVDVTPSHVVRHAISQLYNEVEGDVSREPRPEEPCPECGGRGYLRGGTNPDCKACDGTGYVERGVA